MFRMSRKERDVNSSDGGVAREVTEEQMKSETVQPVGFHSRTNGLKSELQVVLAMGRRGPGGDDFDRLHKELPLRLSNERKESAGVHNMMVMRDKRQQEDQCDCEARCGLGGRAISMRSPGGYGGMCSRRM